MNKVFSELTGSFKSSIKTWDYFVNWQKVEGNAAKLEIALNKLNYLLGKTDLRGEFRKLYDTNPDIVLALPVLLAVRESVVEVYDKNLRTTEVFKFDGSGNADSYYEFIDKSGLARLFTTEGVKNLVDYVKGVEVGLDSNGRKNRGGSLMEEIVEAFVKDFSMTNGYLFMAQATAARMRKEWGVKVKVNKSARSFDCAVYNPISKKLKLFETNFYNGGGSKLKSVCGEFRSLFSELEPQGIDFVWVTDGLGWKTTLRPLEETFNHNKYVFNLSMLESGALNELEW